MSNSYVIKTEQCPKCAELGKDNSQDNLAVYSDGHKFCYSCKYSSFPNGIEKFKLSQEEITEQKETVFLPVDCDIVYPQRALDWIYQYDLTKNDLYANNVLWSDSLQRLIFPVYGNGFLIAWQGRSFNLNSMALAKIPKWYGKGDLSSCFNIMGKGESLTLVEDVISSIKLSKITKSMPLYGCHVSNKRFSFLSTLGYKKINIFLDPDKRKESIKYAKIGSLYGFDTHTIIAEKDPKELDYKILNDLLTKGSI